MSKGSKNCPTNKLPKQKGHYVTSTDCENCSEKCKKGILYLENFRIRHEGNGVFCSK